MTKLFCPESFVSSNYCALESFCWESILVNKICLHLLLSSSPSQLPLQNKVTGQFEKLEGNLSFEAEFESIQSNFSMKRYREKAANI